MTEKFNAIKRKIFVYGTLKRNFNNHYHLEMSKRINVGYIKGFKMFGFKNNFPFIVKTKEKNKKIFGEIYEVDEYYWDEIKRLEKDYIISKVKVYTDGLSHDCFVYIMVNDKAIEEWISKGAVEVKNGNWGVHQSDPFAEYSLMTEDVEERPIAVATISDGDEMRW